MLCGIQLEGHRPRCPRVRMFDVIDVAGCNTGTEAGAPPRSSEGYNKPARPPALQDRSSRVRANHIIVAGSIGGPAASPAADTQLTYPVQRSLPGAVHATSERGRFRNLPFAIPRPDPNERTL